MSAHDTAREKDSLTGVETTGHEWDGIRELDNPLPRWWVLVFYATIVWAVVYWVLMPAWPLWNSYTPGIRGQSDRANVATEVAALQATRAPMFERLLATPLDQVAADPELLTFAQEAGRVAFGDNCATCHGAGGQGNPGYPSLVDDVWLWDGTNAGILQTIRYGIRGDHPDARFSMMPAFGRDGLLTPAQVSDLTDYVMTVGGVQGADAAAAARGAALYATNCVSCHGDQGQGDPTQGAPRLNDQEWLFGGTRTAIQSQIQNGRGGVMQPLSLIHI